MAHSYDITKMVQFSTTAPAGNENTLYVPTDEQSIYKGEKLIGTARLCEEGGNEAGLMSPVVYNRIQKLEGLMEDIAGPSVELPDSELFEPTEPSHLKNISTDLQQIKDKISDLEAEVGDPSTGEPGDEGYISGTGMQKEIEDLKTEIMLIEERLIPLEEFAQSFNTDDLVLSNSLRIGKAVLTYDDTEKALVVSFIE